MFYGLQNAAVAITLDNGQKFESVFIEKIVVELGESAYISGWKFNPSAMEPDLENSYLLPWDQVAEIEYY